MRGRGIERTFGCGVDRRTNVDKSGKEPARGWATAARLILTICPFALLVALYAMHRWVSG